MLIKPDHLLDDCVLSLSFEGKERGIGRIQKGKKIKMRGENSKKKIFSLPPQNVIDQKRKFLYKERGTFFSSGNFFFFLYRYFFLLDHLHVISLMDYTPHHFVAVIPFFLFSPCVTLFWPRTTLMADEITICTSHRRYRAHKREFFFSSSRKMEDDRGARRNLSICSFWEYNESIGRLHIAPGTIVHRRTDSLIK